MGCAVRRTCGMASLRYSVYGCQGGAVVEKPRRRTFLCRAPGLPDPHRHVRHVEPEPHGKEPRQVGQRRGAQHASRGPGVAPPAADDRRPRHRVGEKPGRPVGRRPRTRRPAYTRPPHPGYGRPCRRTRRFCSPCSACRRRRRRTRARGVRSGGARRASSRRRAGGKTSGGEALGGEAPGGETPWQSTELLDKAREGAVCWSTWARARRALRRIPR